MIDRLFHPCAVAAAALAVLLPVTAVTQAAGSQKTATAPPKAAPAKAARTIELQGIDSMKYVPAAIQAKPGETIRVVLKTISKMPKIAMAHNFVLLTPEADVESFVNESMRARATDYIAPKRKAEILAHTGIAGAGETVEVTFTAPKKPGTYTFVCTFPGHFVAGMKGVLTVR